VDEKQQGIYFFNRELPGKVQVNSAVFNDLWYFRMGFPSSQMLSYLSSSIHEDFSSGDKHSLCDVCFRDKQTRMPFLVSNSIASQPFDFIYCDIWGAYHVSSFCGADYFLTILDYVSRAVWAYLMKILDPYLTLF